MYVFKYSINIILKYRIIASMKIGLIRQTLINFEIMLWYQKFRILMKNARGKMKIEH